MGFVAACRHRFHPRFRRKLGDISMVGDSSTRNEFVFPTIFQVGVLVVEVGLEAWHEQGLAAGFSNEICNDMTVGFQYWRRRWLVQYLDSVLVALH